MEPLVFFGLLFGAMFALISWFNASHAKKLRSHLEESFGTISTNRDGEMVARADGVKVRIGKEKVGKHEYFVLRATTPCAVPGTLLRAEGAMDRWAKRVQLALEVQTDDAAFDRDVYLESYERPADLRAFLGDATLRESLRAALVSDRFWKIRFEKNNAYFHAKVLVNTDDAGDSLEPAIETVAAIVNQLPDQDLGRGRAEPRWIKALRESSFLGIVVLFVGWAVAFSPRSRIIEGERNIFLVSLGVALASAAIPWSLARGKSNALGIFSHGALLLGALVFSAVHLPLYSYNEKGAQDPTAQVDAKVLRCDRTKAKGGYNHRAHLQLDEHTTFSWGLTESEFAACQRAKQAEVTVNPGALGNRWVTRVNFDK